MKKLLTVLIMVTVAFGFLSAACDDDDILGNRTGCTSSEASQCAEETTDCIEAVDVTSETAAQDIEACDNRWCDCLDDEGCDELLDDANCN
jgi:hypothetical protein